jgi:hypothetical protein
VHGNGHKPTKIMKKSEKTPQGLYNVGFIGDENETTLFGSAEEPG